jgi:hypothetical protein
VVGRSFLSGGLGDVVSGLRRGAKELQMALPFRSFGVDELLYRRI